MVMWQSDTDIKGENIIAYSDGDVTQMQHNIFFFLIFVP